VPTLARGGRAVAAALGAALLLPACSDDATGPREGSRLAEVTGDTSGSFDLGTVRVGERVSLRVTVGDVLSPESFVVPPRDTAGEPLLVLSNLRPVSAGDEVQVVGIVRVFRYDDLADDYELADPTAYAAFELQEFLVADVVDPDLPADER
jgi:hypothetical protein